MEPRWSLSPQEVPDDFRALLCRLRDEDRGPVLNALLLASQGRKWRAASLAAVLEMKTATVSKRIERARRACHRQEPGWHEIAEEISGMEIPEAPPAQKVINGKELPQEKIEELLRLQRVAAKVNGAMPADAQARRDSERLSAELNRLIQVEGFRPAYLARVMGRSHRAITSRLERHHYRDPCPSVAGTSSGEYRNRKIGDPVEPRE